MLEQRLNDLTLSLSSLSDAVTSLQQEVSQHQTSSMEGVTELRNRVAGLVQQVQEEGAGLRERASEAASRVEEALSVSRQLGENQLALHREIQSQRQTVYLGNNTAVTRTRLGHKIFLDTLDTAICPHILLDGMWEHWITSFVQGKIEPGMVFVDVGANVGWYTLLACEAVGPTGKVIAIEPQPRLVGLLRSTLDVNGFRERTVIHQLALSDHEGQATLYQRANDNGSASLIDWDPEFTLESSVPLTTLDALLGDGRVDFVKLDAEKLEANILRGASQVIAANPHVQLLVEHHPGDQDAIAELSKGGFGLGVIDYSGQAKSIPLDEVPGLPETAMLYLRRD